MKNFKRGQKGFTLVELLIVVAILGILAAVVIPNVVGLLGRGGKQAWETDSNTVEMSVAAFLTDIHTGWHDDLVNPNDDKTELDPAVRPANFLDNVWGDTDAATDPDILAGHYFPTSIAKKANHYLILGNVTDPDNVNNYYLVWSDNTSQLASSEDIQAHAIWMGLVVNAYNEDAPYPVPGGTLDRWQVSPLSGEESLYLDEMPQSAMTDPDLNGDNDPNSLRSGGYCWIVAKDGQVYGVYAKDAYLADGEIEGQDGTNEWYAGFSGSYP